MTILKVGSRNEIVLESETTGAQTVLEVDGNGTLFINGSEALVRHHIALTTPQALAAYTGAFGAFMAGINGLLDLITRLY